MAASSLLVLVLLSFLLKAAQSHPINDYLADRGMPRGIFPSRVPSSSFSHNSGVLIADLYEDSCILNFSTEVSQLLYTNPITATLTLGKVDFTSLVVMKVGPTTLDFHPVKKIVSPFHPLELTLEFWSSENDLVATVLASPFSQEMPCAAESVRENPGAAINHDRLAEA